MNQEKIRIIPATLQDIEELDTLAFAAKASWGYPKHYLEIWHDQIAVQPKMLKQKRMYKATNEQGEIVGFYGLKGKGDTLILEGFWIKPEMMGKGIGKQLFKHMIQTAAMLQAKKIEWESDPNASLFYLRMGAKQIGQKQYILDGKKRVLPIMQYNLNY